MVAIFGIRNNWIRRLIRSTSKTGCRRQLTLVTTLTDAAVYTKEDVAQLYNERWHCELDLNALKTTLLMDRLSCKSPDMVRKEVGMHLLANNLLRHMMAGAARTHDKQPRRLSFKGALQTVEAFAPYFSVLDPARHGHLFAELQRALVQHEVGDRPDRIEPRKNKRRRAKYTFMTQPLATERLTAIKS